jgi:hypothetical protein
MSFLFSKNFQTSSGFHIASYSIHIGDRGVIVTFHLHVMCVKNKWSFTFTISISLHGMGRSNLFILYKKVLYRLFLILSHHLSVCLCMLVYLFLKNAIFIHHSLPPPENKQIELAFIFCLYKPLSLFLYINISSVALFTSYGFGNLNTNGDNCSKHSP